MHRHELMDEDNKHVAETMPLLLEVGEWTLRRWGEGSRQAYGVRGVFAHHTGCVAIVQATMHGLRKCLDCDDPVPEEIYALWYMMAVDEGRR